MTPDAVIEKIQKLLNLAANNPSAEEATAAQAKAQDLMLAHNLDSATVERESGATGKREQALVEGGFYRWQRDLWDDVAEVNFCHYWNQKYRVFVEGRRFRKSADELRWGEPGLKSEVRDAHVARRRHALIGRTVNVRATEVMARYLEAAIARTVRERFPDREDSASMSYREGIVYRIGQRLRERRRELVREEELKAANAAANRAARSGVSTALTVSAYAKSEEDANVDFRYGEGTSARWAAGRAAAAAEERRAREEYTAWAAANPEKAREKEKKEAEKEKRRERAASRERFGGVKHDGLFWAGADAGEKISLDQQVDGGAASPKKIGRK